MKRSLITIAALMLAIMAGALIRQQRTHAQQPFPGYTANYTQSLNCDSRYKNCAMLVSFTKELFPSGESVQKMQLSYIPGSATHWIIITKEHRTEVVPELKEYFRLPNTRLEAVQAYPMSDPKGPCSPGPEYTLDNSLSSYIGHPAVRYQIKTGGSKVGKVGIFLTDASCYPALSIAGFGKGDATYQVTQKITVGTPSLADLQVPLGFTEVSPIDLKHAETVLRFSKQTVPGAIADPEGEWQNMLAGYEGFVMRRQTALWQQHRGE